jgi:hypothetical protein
MKVEFDNFNVIWLDTTIYCKCTGMVRMFDDFEYPSVQFSLLGMNTDHLYAEEGTSSDIKLVSYLH